MRWLLLRGLAREQRHWLGFPDYFAAHVRGPDGEPTRTITLDLPGFGTENDAPMPPTVAGFVDDLRTRLQRSIAPGERCAIFGVSLGGMVALNWLERFPADFAAGVVVNSSLADLSPPWHRLRLANLPRVLLAPLLPLRARERLTVGMIRRRGDLDADAARYAEIAVATPPRRANALAQVRAAMTMRSPDRIDVPTLVLTSHGDRFVSWHCSQRIAERLSLPLRVHTGTGREAAGHDLPLDDPAWVCAQINDWLVTPS